MTAHKFPVFVSCDHRGLYTAQIIDGISADAVGETAAVAVGQLKDYVRWLYRRFPADYEPDFLDPELGETRVSVRPEYLLMDRRPAPSSHRVTIRVPYVHGRRSDGSRPCVLPTLDVAFVAPADAPIARLASEFAEQALYGRPPRDLAQYLPPASVALDSIVVTVRDRDRRRSGEDDDALLISVATPLDDRSGRRRHRRALLRDNDIASLAELLRGSRANLLLVGEHGVGKTTILMDAIRKSIQLAKAAAKHPNEETDRQAEPRRRRFWQTSGANLISGMQFLGQWEQRCEEIVGELAERHGVLCVNNLVGLLQAGGCEPGSSIAAFFAPYLERGELRIVAEATPRQLDACRRLLPGFVDLFQIVMIEPFTDAAARELLDRAASSHEQNLRIAVETGVAEQVYRLFRRFEPYQAFPGPVVDFLSDLFDEARRAAATRLTKTDAVARFSRKTGLPEFLVRDDLPLLAADVRQALRERVIGQEAACDIAAGVVTTFKAGLNDPRRPLGVLLFSGPTGVGKTELAKTLADYLFGHGRSRDRLVRLDMSEYAGLDAAARLLTKPNGEVSDLIDRVRRQPFVVVLLDEIEKAAPEVFDVLLGLLDEGRLTDRFGRETTFASSVIVMTSNLGGQLRTPIGFDEGAAASYEREVREFFRPELFNRIDHVIGFEPLGFEQVLQITRKELRQLANRKGLIRRRIQLAWTEPLIQHLAQLGCDPRYGARPLQRAIEQQVVAPLAHWLLEHRTVRDCEVLFDWDATAGAVRLTSPNQSPPT